MPSNKSATHAVDVQARELERLRADVARLQQEVSAMRSTLRDAANAVRTMVEVFNQARALESETLQRSWLDDVLYKSALRLDQTLARAVDDDPSRKDDDP